MKRLTLTTLLCLGGLAGLSQVSDAFAPWMAAPATSNADQPYRADIEKLSNPDTSQAVIKRLVGEGQSAIPALVRAARTHDNMATRGWAIQGLSQIDAGPARAALQELATDADEDRLVRTWAWAALINDAADLDELSALSTEASGFAALERPISLRAVELAQDGQDAISLLNLVSRFPTLAPALGPLLAKSDSSELVAAMLTARGNQARRQAASYLAAQGQGATKGAAMAATIDGLRFERGDDKVPWAGGALYVPSIQWGRKAALDLVGELIAWHVYCDLNGLTQERSKVVNNLASVGLIRQAGLNRVGYQTDQMLLNYGRVAGRSAVASILERTGARNHSRFDHILAQVK